MRNGNTELNPAANPQYKISHELCPVGCDRVLYAFQLFITLIYNTAKFSYNSKLKALQLACLSVFLLFNINTTEGKTILASSKYESQINVNGSTLVCTSANQYASILLNCESEALSRNLPGTGFADFFTAAAKNNRGNISKYWHVLFSTKGYHDITISTKKRVSVEVPLISGIQYSMDGGMEWNDIETKIPLLYDFTSGNLTNIVLPENCSNNELVILRMMLTDGSVENNRFLTGNEISQFVDIEISGTAYKLPFGSFIQGREINTTDHDFAAEYDEHPESSTMPDAERTAEIIPAGNKGLLDPPTITAANITHINCFGNNNGFIDITITLGAGGDAIASYDWTGPSGYTNNTEDITGLGPGTYDVIVTDINGGTATGSYIINEPAQLIATVTPTNITCNGFADGSIDITLPSGGSGLFEYSIDGISWDMSGSFTPLLPGTYMVLMRDAASPVCSVILSNQPITEPPALTLGSALVSDPILCNGESGTVTLSAFGGTAPLDYTFNSTSNASGIFAAVFAGINMPYSITDALGCGPVSGTINVSEPALLNITGISSNSPVCEGSALTLFSAASGGTGSINYDWTGPDGFVSNIQNPVIPSATIAASGTYTLTVTDANACSATASTLVTVNPIPYLSGTLTPPAVCNNTLFSYTPASATPGVTFNWSRAAVAGISNLAATGTDDPNETLINTSADPISVNYEYTLTANGCTNTQIVAVVVNPSPTLSGTLTPPAICSNTVFSYAPASATVGTLFGWNRVAVAGISNPAASGSNNPNEILINTSSAPVAVTYDYTLTANGCSNIQTVVVIVNPTPSLSSTLTPAAICSNTNFSYIPTSATAGTIFNWSRALVAGISNTAAAGMGNPNETLVNTTANPVIVTYVYSLSANGCPNASTYDVTVTVNPSAVITSTLAPPAICSNTVFSYTPVSSTPGTTFNWSRALVAGISNAAASGAGDPNETLINTTANPINVTYVYTLVANACANPTAFNVIVTVNPRPTLTSSLTPPAICSNTNFSYTPTSATAGTTFGWSRALVAGISNAAASGTGNPNETLINTTANPINVIYVYSLSANGCSNPLPFNVTLTVNPYPTLSSTLTPPAICSNTNFSYIPTSATPGTIFGWNRALVAGISNAAASGTGNPNEVLINTTALPVIVTYVYTLTANGCINASTYTVTVSVNPTSTLTSTLSPPAICSNTVFSYTPTGTIGGTTYSWSRALVAGISNAAASGTGNPNETLINTSANPVIVTYSYTLTAGGCANPSAYNVLLTVNPIATLSSTLTPPAICSNTTFSYTPGSATAGTSFNWSRALVAGISNPALSGTGNPNEILINTTTNPVSVIYVYTLAANGCTNPSTYNVVVTVSPEPVVTVNANPLIICAGASTLLTSSSNLIISPPTLLSESFNTGTVGASGGPNGWTASNSSTGGSTAAAAWTIRPDGYNVNTTYHSNDNSQFYLSDSRTQNGSTTTTYLQSPSFSTVGYSTLSLNFWHYYNYNGTAGEAARVQVSTDNTVWTTVATYTSDQGGPTAFVNPTINLNAYTGNATLYVRFYYYCGGRGRYWAIDNVSVSGTAASTATVSWVSSPAGFTSSVSNPPAVSPTTTTTYTVTYTNTSTGCQSGKPVTVTVNPTPVIPNQTVSACSLTAFNLSPVNGVPTAATIVPPGTTYAWGVPVVTGGITGGSAQTGQASISQTLTNPAVTAQTATYTVTPSTLSCTGSAFTVVVTVQPRAIVNAVANTTFCSGVTAAAINFGSTVAGVTYNWTSTADVGFGTSGTGNIASYTTANPNTVPLTATISVTATINGCTGPVRTFTVTVNPKPATTITANYCAVPGYIQLTASPTTGHTYLWSTGQTINPIAINIAGMYSVTATNVYGCASTAVLTCANELVVNGNFSAGNTGFTSTYTYAAPAVNSLWTAGRYSIYWDPNFTHSNFWGRDHTTNTGNMMIVNGSGSPVSVWQQVIPVVPGTDYYFSAWAISLNNVTPFAQLRFNINGGLIGTTAVLPAGASNNLPPYNWVQFYGNWNSGTATSATIQIIDLQTALGGNDFGLDDISFGTLAPFPATISPTSNGAALCAGQTLNLFANLTGGMAPFTYAWAGPAGFTSTLENPSIPNVTAANGGNYTLTVTDGYGCAQVVNSTTATVYPLPTATVSGTTAVCQNGASPNITFTGANGTAPYTFTYKINGGADLTVTTTSGNSVTVSVPTGTSGTYIYSLVNVAGALCSNPQTGTATVTVNPTPSCSINGTSPVCPASSANVYTAPAGMTSYLWSISGNGTISGATNGVNVSVNAGATCSVPLTLTLSVTDINGCTSSCSRNIVVQDIAAPTWVTAAGNLNRTLQCSDAAGIAAAQLLVPIASDNCSASLTPIKTSGIFVTGACAQSGTYTNTWTVTDACGNTAAAVYTQVINIIDNTQPVWTNGGRKSESDSCMRRYSCTYQCPGIGSHSI